MLVGRRELVARLAQRAAGCLAGARVHDSVSVAPRVRLLGAGAAAAAGGAAYAARASLAGPVAVGYAVPQHAHAASVEAAAAYVAQHHRSLRTTNVATQDGERRRTASE